MYLTCTSCPDDRFYLAKYYPSTGWYVSRECASMGDDLHAWLQAHHCDYHYGHNVVLTMETEPSEQEVDETAQR
jgi:hypothetical protein